MGIADTRVSRRYRNNSGTLVSSLCARVVRNALAKEPTMSFGAKLALTAAIAMSIVATAAAAPGQQKNAAYRNTPRAQPSTQRTVPFANPYSPEATGGGSIGYNNSVLIQR